MRLNWRFQGQAKASPAVRPHGGSSKRLRCLGAVVRLLCCVASVTSLASQAYAQRIRTQDLPGFPTLLQEIKLWRHQGQEYRAIVLPLLGRSLAAPGAVSSALEALAIAQQIVDRVRVVHDKGWLVRDLKPHNLLLPREDGCAKDELSITLIDLAMISPWRRPNGTHISEEATPHSQHTGGTPFFASRRANRGLVVSRRRQFPCLPCCLLAV